MSTSSIPPRKAEPGTEPLTELPLVLTIREAAELLRCSARHISNLIDRKELVPFYVGRLVRIHRHELIRFISQEGENQ